MRNEVAAALGRADDALRRVERPLAARAAPRPGNLRVLALGLSSACNLACSYCSQGEKRPGRMEWVVVRCALDHLLAGGHLEPEVCFYGGEPLLEPRLLERAIAYVRRHEPPGVRTRFSISTNGTLLNRRVAALLAEHAVETSLSFDGVEEAQEQRAPGTFAALDHLLVLLRREHPSFFRERLTVKLTLTSRNLPYLAASIRYFLRRGVRAIAVAPLATHDEWWRPTMIEELGVQFSSALAALAAHRRRTGTIGWSALRWHPLSATRRRRNVPMCGVCRGDKVVVDADGEAFACAAPVGTARPHAGLAREAWDRLRLGSILDPRFRRRLAAVPASLRDCPMFSCKELKRSSYARCGECRLLASCLICPVSIAAIRGNTDPHLVPDLPCAWNLVTGAFRLRLCDPMPVELHDPAPGPASAVRQRERRDSDRRRGSVAEPARSAARLGCRS